MVDILTKGNLIEAKTAPTAVSRTITPLARKTRIPSVRIHFSHLESAGKWETLGWGSNRNPDLEAFSKEQKQFVIFDGEALDQVNG